MRIENCGSRGSIEVMESVFPDGQPHIILRHSGVAQHVRIIAAITNATDLFNVLLARETLLTAGANSIKLDITYLLAARMDRPISPQEPFTLKVVAELLRGKFDKIRVLDPHSDVACALLDAAQISPYPYMWKTIESLGWRADRSDVALCSPDAGATKKVEACALAAGGFKVVQCLKHRDTKTGKLSGFRLASPYPVPEKILILDDICDGGGTFSGVAELLRDAGAKYIALYVTHGIFSKGFEIKGIDKIFTTKSYRTDYPDSITVVGAGLDG